MNPKSTSKDKPPTKHNINLKRGIPNSNTRSTSKEGSPKDNTRTSSRERTSKTTQELPQERGLPKQQDHKNKPKRDASNINKD